MKITLNDKPRNQSKILANNTRDNRTEKNRVFRVESVKIRREILTCILDKEVGKSRGYSWWLIFRKSIGHIHFGSNKNIFSH